MRCMGLSLRAATVALTVGALLLVTAPGAPAAYAAATAAPQLHVSGNRLVDATGHTVVLHGVNRSGGEFACIGGWGIWDGPMDQSSIDAMKTWGVNSVRVPVNEACWNAESYVDSDTSGTAYRQAVEDYVELLNQNGMVAIIDLHWTDGAYTGDSSGCASAQAVCQKPMPDAAQAVPFWSSVATAFKGNNAVIFDLFNEPYPERATGDEATGWSCWLNGGTCSGITYSVAGMQQLVNAVRAAGASNVIALGGLAYSNDLTSWLAYEPTDPKANLMAAWHSYSFNSCGSASCWDSEVTPVAAQVPLLAGEIGENDCGTGYIDPLMDWLDSQGASYTAWTWNTWDCSSGPALISDYSGTPTVYGAGYKAHLLALARAPSHLKVSAATNPTVAGAPHSVTVTALDSNGNTATAYTGTIHFTSSDPSAVLPADYTFIAADKGVHKFTAALTLKTVGSKSVTATDKATASIHGTQSGIVVTPAAARTFTVSVAANPTVAGAAHSVTVTALDADGNVATGYTGTIHFTSSDAQAVLPGDYTFSAGDSGSHKFTGALTLKTAGARSVTVTDIAHSSIKGSQTITVTPVRPGR